MSEVKAGPSRNPERTCARCNDDCHARVISLERALAEANYRIGVLSAPRGGMLVLEAELLARSETATKMSENAARWRFARTIFAREDVERAVEDMRGFNSIEEENAKADAAIDKAMRPRERAASCRACGYEVCQCEAIRRKS